MKSFIKMKYLLQIFSLCFLAGPLFADLNSHQDHHPCLSSNNSLCVPISSRPDAHAPIGVMGDHGHKQGKWMVSSRLIFRQMGRSPSFHDMWMFMPGVMYGVTDKFTVMAMASSYRYKPMSSYTMSRHEQKTGISFTGMYSPLKRESYKTLLTFRLFASSRVLDGLQGAFVFVNYWSKYSVGSQIGLTSIYKGSLNSFFGIMKTEGFVNVWGARVLNENASLSARIKYRYRKAFNRGSPHWAFFYVGGNFIGTDFAQGHRLALEIGTPFNKPSLIALLGWQKTF